MTAKKLIRWSHLSLILGGLYEVIVPFLFRSKGFIGWGLVILGLIGLHARQARKVGWLGHLGLGLILISSILPVAFGIARGSSLESNLPLLAIVGVQFVGLFVYGIATLRAKTLPKEVGYLLLLSIITTLIAGIGLSVVGILMGYILWRKKNLDELPISVSSPQQPA